MRSRNRWLWSAVLTLTLVVGLLGAEPARRALAAAPATGVASWGYNGYGQLGNSSNTSSDVPVQVSGLTGVTAIAGGGPPQSGAEE